MNLTRKWLMFKKLIAASPPVTPGRHEANHTSANNNYTHTSFLPPSSSPYIVALPPVCLYCSPQCVLLLLIVMLLSEGGGGWGLWIPNCHQTGWLNYLTRRKQATSASPCQHCPLISKLHLRKVTLMLIPVFSPDRTSFLFEPRTKTQPYLFFCKCIQLETYICIFNSILRQWNPVNVRQCAFKVYTLKQLNHFVLSFCNLLFFYF